MISKKLKNYIALSTGALATMSVNADVIYTDVDPDTTVTALGQGTYNIDFNNDGDGDISIYGYNSTSYSWYFIAIDGNETTYSIGGPNNRIVGSFSGYVPYASMLSNSISIGQNSPFFTDVNYAMGPYAIFGSSYGPFQGVNTDKYIGAKFEIGSNIHYGWIKVDSKTDANSKIAEMTIKSFAYESIPDSSIMTVVPDSTVIVDPIDTTSTTTSINTILEDNNSFYSFNKTLYVNKNIKGTITIHDLKGTKMYFKQLANSNYQFDLNTFKSGLYIVNIIADDNSIINKTIFIK